MQTAKAVAPFFKALKPRYAMSAHIYKKIELVGSSATSIEDAVNNAVAKAAESVRNIRWVEILETRCHVEEQKVAYWQVTVKIGFTLDEN